MGPQDSLSVHKFATRLSQMNPVHTSHPVFLISTFTDLLIMLIGWANVSELLWPPMGLFFIPHVIYEHGEPWWNDTDTWKLSICPPELSGNSTSSHLVASRRNTQRNMMNLPCAMFLFILPKWIFLHAIKSYDIEPPALLHLQRTERHRLDWVRTCTPWVQWQVH
jgi:hypothetical protein